MQHNILHPSLLLTIEPCMCQKLRKRSAANTTSVFTCVVKFHELECVLVVAEGYIISNDLQAFFTNWHEWACKHAMLNFRRSRKDKQVI